MSSSASRIPFVSTSQNFGEHFKSKGKVIKNSAAPIKGGRRRKKAQRGNNKSKVKSSTNSKPTKSKPKKAGKNKPKRKPISNSKKGKPKRKNSTKGRNSNKKNKGRGPFLL